MGSTYVKDIWMHKNSPVFADKKNKNISANCCSIHIFIKNVPHCITVNSCVSQWI